MASVTAEFGGGINSAGNSFVWCCEIKAMVLALDF
jgi:hypothetical protein